MPCRLYNVVGRWKSRGEGQMSGGKQDEDKQGERDGQSENSGIRLFTCASGLRLKRLLWFGQYALRTQEPTQISEAKTTAAY
ncbi:hypothetical protein T02_3952 [Trichinella nativa]|uniref:Uncharacterized protein n=1 Tax=Trichinella nativa TaxID=6335 RepID=A0A0V1KQ46_9BILA|nr:hypothetical protein T02_3952 [Trichinella nativa]